MRETLTTIITALRKVARACADERGAGVTEYVSLAVGGLIVAGVVITVLTLWANGMLKPMGAH